MKLPRTLLIACLCAASLHAQQGEPKTDATQSPLLPAHEHGMQQPEKKSVAYIGLLTREVPAELRAQFSLPEGFGLLVDEVLPDSPAKAAGLKEYDLLVKLEDQQLVNREQFMSLVRARKKGDVVQLNVITGGKETKVSVTLGEHQVTAHEHPRHHSGFAGAGQPEGRPDFNGAQPHGFQHQNGALHEQFERLQQELREYQQRMQEWSKGGGSNNGPMPQPPAFNLPGHEGSPQQPQDKGHRHNHHQTQTGISIPPGTDLQRFNFSQSAATVTRRDDSGEYTVKSENGQKTFIAHPKNGQQQTWPINTDAERQAVPQEFRDKLRLMDSANGGIRIEINPAPEKNPPGPSAPSGGDSSPALPPVKAQTTSA